MSSTQSVAPLTIADKRERIERGRRERGEREGEEREDKERIKERGRRKREK